jgi:predicted ArsR family transcriptional regulator
MKSSPRRGKTPELSSGAENQAGPPWTFLTNHAHVLILLSQNASRVLREVAQEVGITERAVQRIVVDLEAAGVISREKVGRQNHYRINADQPLRHSIEAHRSIGDLIDLIRDRPHSRQAGRRNA